MPKTTEERVALDNTECRAQGDDGVISGYAAVFDSLSHDLGGFRERIAPGAFTETLAEGRDVAARLQHEGGLTTLGRLSNSTLSLKQDGRGLHYRVKLNLNTSIGSDVFESVKRGDINQVVVRVYGSARRRGVVERR